VQQSVAGLSGRALSFDLGASALLTPGTTVAVAAQQLGGELRLGSQSAALPRTLRVGAAHGRRIRQVLELTLVGELRGVSGLRGVTAAGGGELRWLGASPVNLAARVGGAGRARGQTVQPISFGGSVFYNGTAPVPASGLVEERLAVDYAYQTFRDLGGVHRLGVRWWR
jgi:hypothetical protein